MRIRATAIERKCSFLFRLSLDEAILLVARVSIDRRGQLLFDRVGQTSKLKGDIGEN